MDITSMVLPTVKNIPISGIREIFDLANEMNDVIKLNIGEPDFLVPSVAREAGINSIKEFNTKYSHNCGILELREEICRDIYETYDIKYCPQKQIITTLGASEALDIALRAIAGPGDEVIIPEPCYESYKVCTRLTGATPVTISLNAEENFKLTPELLEKAITDKTKALILSYPNNPTGAIMTEEDLKKIVEILKSKDIIVISDEIYSEFCYGAKHVSIASFKEMKEKTLLINGFSKCSAMTGWRIGYICGHSYLIKQMLKIHQYSIISSSSIAQYAALEAIKIRDRYVLPVVEEYNKRRERLVNGLKEFGFSDYVPLGAFYMLLSIKSTGMNSSEFCKNLLFEEKVALVPGSVFGKCGESYARICYASNSIETIDEAIVRIKRFIFKYNSYHSLKGKHSNKYV